MKALRQKIASLLLAFCMLTTVIPANASAVEYRDTGSEQTISPLATVEYTLSEDGVLTISGGYYMLQSTDLSGVDKTAVKRVVVEDGVTRIDSYVFQDFTEMESVTLPNTVTSIGHEAFMNCRSLRAVVLPNGLTEVGGGLFNGCSALCDMVIPNSLNYIGDGMFDSCTSLEHVYIPGSITRIGFNAFINSGLTEISLPVSVESIGGYAFHNCAALTEIIFLGNAPHIDETPFDSTVTLYYFASREGWSTPEWNGYAAYPMEVTEIASGFCGGEENGENLTWTLTNEGVLTITGTGAMANYEEGPAPWAEHSDDIAVIVVTDGVTTIGFHAFTDCTEMFAINIPDTVTSIGNRAFVNCTALANVIFVGTKAQWENISIVSDNDPLLSATISYSGANSGECGQNATWTLSGDGTLTINGTGMMAHYSDTDPAPCSPRGRDHYRHLCVLRMREPCKHHHSLHRYLHRRLCIQQL